jgi:hypothetical protein
LGRLLVPCQGTASPAANAQHGTYSASGLGSDHGADRAGQERLDERQRGSLIWALGKGFGNFDVQTAAGVTFPTGTPAITTAGRPIAWNTVAQYRAAKIFWPEVESNATFYRGGANERQDPGVHHSRHGDRQVRAAPRRKRVAPWAGIWRRHANRHQPLSQLQPRADSDGALDLLAFNLSKGHLAGQCQGIFFESCMGFIAQGAQLRADSLARYVDLGRRPETPTTAGP